MSKILFITPMWHEEPTPHDAKVCNYFVDDWIKQGHEVVVVHYRSQFPEIYHKIASVFPSLYRKLCGDNTRLKANIPERDYIQNGCRVLSIPIYKYVPHGRISNRSFRKQADHLVMRLAEKGFTPDTIIGHFCNPTIGIISRIKASFSEAKTAVVLHEGAATICRIFGEEGEKVLNSVDAIGFRSVSIKNDITSNFNLKNHQFMCYSGVAASFVERDYQPRKWSDGALEKFLFVGRMVAYKYPQVVVTALAKVYPQKDFSLTYIGNKANAYPPTLRNTEETCTTKQVAFLGQINREEIIAWYDKTDCFVMISDHEVFGLVYLEAMSRGCIVIAGDNGGMVGIIEHGINGFLCKPGDEEVLAEIIRSINTMSAVQKSLMSQRARETAIRFTDEKVSKEYLKNVVSH